MKEYLIHLLGGYTEAECRGREKEVLETLKEEVYRLFGCDTWDVQMYNKIVKMLNGY